MYSGYRNLDSCGEFHIQKKTDTHYSAIYRRYDELLSDKGNEETTNAGLRNESSRTT